MRIRTTSSRTVLDSAGNTVTGNANTEGTVRCMKCGNMATATVTPKGQRLLQCPACKAQYVLKAM